MKHFFVRRFRMNSDLFADSEATKKLMFFLAVDSNELCLQGYVQKIDHDPFGILLLSDIQVKLFVEF